MASLQAAAPGSRPVRAARTPPAGARPRAQLERGRHRSPHQALPGAAALQHGVARAGDLEPAQAVADLARRERVGQRAGGAGRAVARAVRDHDRAAGQLDGGLAGRQPGGERHHGAHALVPGAAEHAARAHRVADHADRDVAVAARDLRQRPLHIGDGIALVVATHAVTELERSQAGVAAGSVQVEQERVHAKRRRVDRDARRVLVLRPPCASRATPRHRAARREGHERGRRAVGRRHGRCDATDSLSRGRLDRFHLEGGGQTPASCVRWM